ncbi:MAG TPA: hypothetical protein VF669_13475 [Tepidisphaeraceae bacterium]|jgi:hypothetical protein
MPSVIPYEQVLSRMGREGFVSLYYNAGAFGFAPDVAVEIVGWIGPGDPSIREQMRAQTIAIAPPHETNLARLLARAWESLLAGELWLMPKSHWAYELDFGNASWLPETLAGIGIDAKELQPLTNAAAIAFAAGERQNVESFAAQLLTHLHGSDFLAAFPAHRTVATLHHHKQIWWQTPVPALAERLRALPRHGVDQSTQSSS